MLIESSQMVAESLVELLFNRFSFAECPMQASVFTRQRVGALVKPRSTIHPFAHRDHKNINPMPGDLSDDVIDIEESLSLKSSISSELKDDPDERQAFIVAHEDVSLIFDQLLQTGVLPPRVPKPDQPVFSLKEFKEVLQEASLRVDMPFPNNAINFRLFLKQYYKRVV